MKRMNSAVLFCLMAVSLVFGGAAQAYDINDTTLVKAYLKGAEYNNTLGGKNYAVWQDVIGDAAIWDVYGINVNRTGTDLSFEIFTNFSGNYSPLSWMRYGDLLFDVDGGGYDYGIVIALHDGLSAGQLYSVNNLKTSYDYFKDLSGWVYGGRYDQPNPKYVPVSVDPAGAQLLATGSVSRTGLSGGVSDPDYRIDVVIPLTNLNLSAVSFFDVFWSVALCGNDVVTGKVPVPEPGTLLLLGLGLACVTLTGRRGLRR